VFFTNFFDQLVGNSTIKQDIISETDALKIQTNWSQEVNDFKKIRKKYLLYKDFE
jgi:uncharacterized protein YbbC (DUF1343 family)